VTGSEDLFTRALRVIPGGVHSPVRAFKGVGGKPVFIESAQGATLTDVDGRSFVDFCMAFGPLIFGHADPDVREATTRALEKGWSFGTAETVSLELAELICANIPWIDSVRFVNSGTEAVMSAIRLARAATGRNKLLKFDGCYHGHADSMLIRAGSGLAGTARPDSAGVPDSVSAETLIAPLDDEPALENIFDMHGGEIAAVIIEPVPANHGLLPQEPDFLHRIEALCLQSGALLIFDEVITGFRLSFGGYAEISAIQPDIVTWGKIIGGGFPVGAFAAKRTLMDQMAPLGPVYQAGTLSANPIAMTAGLTTLQKLLDGTVYSGLENLGQQLDAMVDEIEGLAIQRRGSMFWLKPGAERDLIRSRNRFPDSIGRWFPAFYQALLSVGIYMPPSPYEVGFLSTAHDPSHIALLGDALRKNPRAVSGVL
jgi:glutamate-1-semialdehyde 2,1-aminomutase